MNVDNKVARVTYRWDDQPGVEAGWYCETFGPDGRLCDDSWKVWFPVAVDDYREDEAEELVASLQAAFPTAEITEG